MARVGHASRSGAVGQQARPGGSPAPWAFLVPRAVTSAAAAVPPPWAPFVPRPRTGAGPAPARIEPPARAQDAGPPVRLQVAGLPLSRPSDPVERAADALAARAVPSASPPASASPPPSDPASTGAGAAARAFDGPGEALPDRERRFFEGRFGHDLSGVRLHTDAPAALGARALGAEAFTARDRVAFAAVSNIITNRPGSWHTWRTMPTSDSDRHPLMPLSIRFGALG